MLLITTSALSLSGTKRRDHLNNSLFSSSPSFLRSSSSSLLRFSQKKGRDGFMVSASMDVVFEPFEEVKRELFLLRSLHGISRARQNYTDQCEAAVNEHINFEFNVSYVYHSMYAYFHRDNVALEGLAKFFKESNVEARQNAERLMEYQNKRGGRVKLQSIGMPLSEYDDNESGDALYAMELALALERIVNEKLRVLHSVATQFNDVQLAEFIEKEFLSEQARVIKKVSDYVSQLRRVGKGRGVWQFDKMLLNGEVVDFIV